MENVRTVSLYVVIALLVVACAFGIDALLNPPFTDREIQASIVDTWQVEAHVTATMLILFCLALILSGAFAFVSEKTSTRVLATIAGLLSLLAGAIQLYGHAVLTERAALLTGQTFGRIYGLF